MLDWFEPGGLFEGSFDITVARTAAFTCLVFAQLFNALSARSAGRPPSGASSPTSGCGERSCWRCCCRWRWSGPILQSAFKTAPLT